jgi:hypothetical protein
MIFDHRPQTTMQFRFIALNGDGSLQFLGDLEATGAYPEVMQQVERHFEQMVKTIEAAQVLVLCPGLGDPPGCVVAAEIVYLAFLNRKVKPSNRVRTLVWLVEEYVPKH